ncbi:MAG: choice-of-anchor D domain-containing protein [Verrucomicrobia bacterium]|nr:choice-of-anchor D domain-containing protein [Verrucomicrobiota bacterium]
MPDIDVVPTALGFGNQLVGSLSITQTVTIQNTGSADLHVNSISSSSSQFLLTLGTSLPATIVPGGSLAFGMHFAPTSVGAKSGSVTVSSDDPDESTRTVSCAGTGVVPDIDLMPTALGFGNQLLGTTSAPQMVTIENTGSADLHVNSLSSSSSEFPFSMTVSLPATIAPGGSLMFQVRFAPTTPGAKSGTVTVSSDDPGESTRTVSCTGTGVVPDIDLMPTALNFANQLLGTTSAPQTVTIQNTGSADLHVASVQTTNSEFMVSLGTSLPATIIPGGSLPIQVRFAPTSVGAKTGRITLRSDDPEEPEIHVDCAGKSVLPPVTTLTLTPQPPGKLEVQLDRLVYDAADSISAMLLVRDGQLAAEQLGLVLAGSQSRDVEVITVRRSADGRRYVADVPVPVGLFAEGEAVRPLDQVLTLRPGEMFFAIYYTNPGRDHDVLSGEDLVADFATLADPAANALAPQIIPELALTEDERVPVAGAKRMGTITHAGGLPLQIATEELIFRPRDSQQLAAFLEVTGGRVVLTDLPRQEQSGRTQPNYYLVRVNPAVAKLHILPDLQALAGRRTKLIASSADALRICTLALEHRLNGFDVGVNARLQFMDRPLWSPNSEPFRDNIGLDSFRWPPFDIPKVWSFMALWDKDLNRVPVAFLDQGFSPNSDFRPPLTECDMAGANLVEGLLVDFTCGPGTAVSPPTTGNSFFGDKSWHGNGVVTVAGGIVNNGYGAAGTGGQVVDPMLYRFDAVSYVFETGLGIRQATLDGAALINISAGYPCRILTTFGIGFDICDPVGRAELCLAVETALVVAAGAVCAVAAEIAGIPVVGPFLAIDATIACLEANLAVVLAVPACVALVALGDVREPMEDAVAFALGSGVTIVACAGNKLDPDKLPEVIRPFLDLDNINVSDWQMIPAVIPGVLRVGAIEWSDPDGHGPSPGFWVNAHFNGDRVDIWAPIKSRYYAPVTTDAVEPDPALHVPDLIGGTSAATPYISGLIANLIAIDPTLNPLNAALTPAQRSAIPGLVRSLLVDNATTLLPEGETVVAPLATVQAAAAAVLPAFAKDYDESINFSETSPDASQDLPATAFDLGTLNDAAHPAEQTGTILTIPGPAPSGVEYTDEDWFRFDVPDVSAAWPAGMYQTTILLYTPAADTFGTLSISGQGFSEGNHAWAPPSANESVREFLSPLLFNGGSNRFRVHDDGAGSDNVYFVRAFTAWVAPPPDGDRFDQDNDNNRRESRPDNNRRSRAVHLGEDNGEFAWQMVPGPDARWPEVPSITIPDLSFHNTDDVDCFQIVHLPPYEFYGDRPGCQPTLRISWEPGVRLEIWRPDTGQPFTWDDRLFTFESSPAEIPGEDAFDGMILRLLPSEPGEYITYSLTLTFLPPVELLCGYPDDGGGSGWGGGADGGGPFFFPQYRPLVTDAAELAAYRRGFAELVRVLDSAGRVITPDLYVIHWIGGGVFRAAAAIETGDSIRVSLFTPQGVEVARASLGDPTGGATPLITRDQLGRPYVVLEAPSLPPGSYVLTLSHARPGTRLEVFLPAGATANGATTSEVFLRDYRWTTGIAEPETLPASPIRLGAPTLHDGTTVLTLFTERGVNYRVEATESLATPRWQTLRYLSGDGRVVTFSDQAGTRQRFYRVRVGGE